MAKGVSRSPVVAQGAALAWSELVGEDAPVKLMRLSSCWLLIGEPTGYGDVHATYGSADEDPIERACVEVARWARLGRLARAAWRVPLIARPELVARLMRRRGVEGSTDAYDAVRAELDITRGLRVGVDEGTDGDLVEVLAGGTLAGLDVLTLAETVCALVREWSAP